MKIKSLILVIILCVMPVLSFAEKGLKIEASTEYSTSGEKVDNLGYITSNKMYFKGADPNSGSETFIFKALQNEIYILNDDNKTYRVIDRQFIMQMQQMIEMMKQQLKNMPEQQRRSAKEQMMSRGVPIDDVAVPEYKLIKEGVKVGDFTTTHYKIYEDGKLESEVWGVSPSVFGVDYDDFYVFERLGEQMGEMFGARTSKMTRKMILPKEYNVIPVKTVVYNEDGEILTTSYIKDINKMDIPDSKFAIPEGYEKIEMPGMGGGMQR